MRSKAQALFVALLTGAAVANAEEVTLSVVGAGSPLNHDVVRLAQGAAHVGAGDVLKCNVDSSNVVSFAAVPGQGGSNEHQVPAKDVNGYLTIGGNSVFTAVKDETNGGYVLYSGLVPGVEGLPISLKVERDAAHVENPAVFPIKNAAVVGAAESQSSSVTVRTVVDSSLTYTDSNLVTTVYATAVTNSVPAVPTILSEPSFTGGGFGNVSSPSATATTTETSPDTNTTETFYPSFSNYTTTESTGPDSIETGVSNSGMKIADGSTVVSMAVVGCILALL